MTAWKRIYIENDKMAKKSEPLLADVGAADTSVRVSKATTINVGDKVVLFDTVQESSIERTVTAKVVGGDVPDSVRF